MLIGMLDKMVAKAGALIFSLLGCGWRERIPLLGFLFFVFIQFSAIIIGSPANGAELPRFFIQEITKSRNILIAKNISVAGLPNDKYRIPVLALSLGVAFKDRSKIVDLVLLPMSICADYFIEPSSDARTAGDLAGAMLTPATMEASAARASHYRRLCRLSRTYCQLPGEFGSVSTITCAKPAWRKPRTSAASVKTSTILPVTKGPRSFTDRTAERLLDRLVTRT
jgi:hypothetical protein